MKNRWLDWEPEPQIMGNAPDIEPAKPAEISPSSVAVDVPGTTVAACAAKPRTAVSQVSRGSLRHLVGRWLCDQCVTTSLCASSLSALSSNFLHWGKVAPDGDVEKMFVEELLQRGFATDEAGFVSGLVLTEDLAAALHYERAAYQAGVRPLAVRRSFK